MEGCKVKVKVYARGGGLAAKRKRWGFGVLIDEGVRMMLAARYSGTKMLERGTTVASPMQRVIWCIVKGVNFLYCQCRMIWCIVKGGDFSNCQFRMIWCIVKGGDYLNCQCRAWSGALWKGVIYWTANAEGDLLHCERGWFLVLPVQDDLVPFCQFRTIWCHCRGFWIWVAFVKPIQGDLVQYLLRDQSRLNGDTRKCAIPKWHAEIPQYVQE